MRVRPASTTTAESFSEALERVGGSVFPVGKTLELVHPSGSLGTFEEMELRFFVRAWAVASGDPAGVSLRIVEPATG